MLNKIIDFGQGYTWVIGPIDQGDKKDKSNVSDIETTLAAISTVTPPCLPWDYQGPIGPVEIEIVPKGQARRDEEKLKMEKLGVKSGLKTTITMMQEPVSTRTACDESEPAEPGQSKKIPNKKTDQSI